MEFKRKYTRKKVTEYEKMLWDRIPGSKISYKFKRQHSIGPYIVDFYCASNRFVIEIDGSIHRTKDQIEYDTFRTRYFKTLGVKKIRFWNDELKDVETAIKRIRFFLS